MIHTLYRRPGSFVRAGLLTSLLAFPQTSWALGFQQVKGFEELPQTSRSLSRQHFGANPFAGSPSFRLFGSGTVSFGGAIKGLIKETGLPFGYEVRETKSGFGLTGGASSDFRFFVGGIPVCGHSVRAHRAADGSILILGKAPEALPRVVRRDEWPDLELSFHNLSKEIEDRGLNGAETRLTKANRCLWATESGLAPVWEMTAISQGLPYHATGDGYELYRFSRGFFAVDGLARVYENNDLDGKLVDVTLKDLVGDGTLASEFLKVIPNAEAGYKPLVQKDNQFIFDPTSEEFEETTAYAHAQSHHEFFKGIGFQWYGPKPLEVRIHERPHGQTNNALFVPADSVGMEYPTIYIGDGDGKALQNLGRDADVVSHEFGHHVIYQHLRSTEGDSLVLHEGLADFFAFSRTSNACLGESICPNKSLACWVEAKCLRTAENNLKYNDSLYIQLLEHHKGQVISGMLWDLFKGQKIPMDELTRLAFRAVSLLTEESGFEHWILALFHADQELFASKYYDDLKATATERGFDVFFANVPDKGEPVPQPSEVDEKITGPIDLPGDKVEKKETSKSETVIDKACSTVGLEGASAALVLILMFLVPLAIPLAPARVRTKRSRR